MILYYYCIRHKLMTETYFLSNSSVDRPQDAGPAISQKEIRIAVGAFITDAMLIFSYIFRVLVVVHMVLVFQDLFEMRVCRRRSLHFKQLHSIKTLRYKRIVLYSSIVNRSCRLTEFSESLL